MTDRERRQASELVPVARADLVAPEASLVRRGLDLLGQRELTLVAARIRERAEAGDASAQFDLSVAYSSGEGVPQDRGLAAFWCRKAAEQGLAVAQANFGYMYQHGSGVPQDDVLAAAWCQKAAEQGSLVAQFSKTTRR